MKAANILQHPFHHSASSTEGIKGGGTWSASKCSSLLITLTVKSEPQKGGSCTSLRLLEGAEGRFGEGGDLVCVQDAHELATRHQAAFRVDLSSTAVQVARLPIHLPNRPLAPRHVLHLWPHAVHPVPRVELSGTSHECNWL